VVDRIAKDMMDHGYDSSFPVLLCEVPEVETFLLDGHMRIMAAQKSGIDIVPYELKAFKAIDEALDYAIHVQRDRRNITDAELYQQIHLVDKRRKKGVRVDGHVGKSATRTAALLGTSTRKVETVRQISSKATPAQIKEITDGKRSINSVLTELNAKKNQDGPIPQSLTPEYENLAVKIMMVTTELIPGIENISDEKSAKWEEALVQLIYQNSKRFGATA